ncbi:MAG: DUF2202 domain-containing protein [Anaerolineae bacterium]|nr:DUF2202 domain-containing protein [Anaerolineae bacterium]
MGKKILGVGAVVLVGALVIGIVAVLALPGAAEAAGLTRRGEGRAPADTTNSGECVDVGSVEPLSASEVEALRIALDDEYKAWSVYEQVIDDFGAVRPFTRIQRAEESHITAVVRLFDRYELDAPVNEWQGQVPSYDTVAEACAAGVQAEVDNGTLYDQLFDMVDNPDIIRVFTALQKASETRHLPAFERCAP